MKLSPSLLNHFAVLFMKACIVIGIFTLAFLSFGCSDQTHMPDEPRPIVSPSLALILPNTTWLERLGEPLPNYATQYRDNPDGAREICHMDIGAGETLLTCLPRQWALEGDSVLVEFDVTPEGVAFDIIRFEVIEYDFNRVHIKPILHGGSGTDRILERG